VTGSRDYLDTIPCGASPTRTFDASERANYLRDLWPLAFAYTGLVVLAFFRLARPTTLHRSRFVPDACHSPS
jgi:hypothetical protein